MLAHVSIASPASLLRPHSSTDVALIKRPPTCCLWHSKLRTTCQPLHLHCGAKAAAQPGHHNAKSYHRAQCSGSRHQTCRLSAVGQSSAAPEPSQQGQLSVGQLSVGQLSVDGIPITDSEHQSLGFWTRVRKHPWMPVSLANLIYAVQHWTSWPPILSFFTEAWLVLPQLTYPTWSEIVWKSVAVVLGIVVLMVIVCTLDSGYLYFLVKLMRRPA